MSSKNKKEEIKKEIKPKQSKSEESEFIVSTMENIKERKEEVVKEEKKDVEKELEEKKKIGKKGEKKEKPKKTENTHETSDTDKEFIKHIDEVQEDISRNLEVQKIVKPSTPYRSIRRTAELFSTGWHYFVDIEEKITQDFFFGWLPRKIKKYVKIIIPFTFLFIVLSLPVKVEPEIKKAVALFLCISLLWALESINIVVTALMIPVLSVLMGVVDSQNPFSSFSNPIIYLLMSGLIIAQAFRKHELDKMLAIKVLSVSKGKIKRLLFLTMFITALLGMWMSNTATIALLIPVILSVSAEVNNRLQRNYTGMLLLSSGFSAAIGGLGTIIGSNPNAITAAFLNNQMHFSFFQWTVIGFPAAVIVFIVAYVVFLRIYNVGDETIKITAITQEARELKFNHVQKKTLLIFFPTIFIWLFGEQIGLWLNLYPEIFRTEVIGLTAAILLFTFGVLEWEDVRRIPWEVFLIVGGGLTLGQILIDTGTASFTAHKLFTVVSVFPNWMIILSVVVLSIVLANFVTNSSTTIILVPVLMNLSSLLDMDPILLAMTAAMATAVAPLTPIAMPSFSLIYGTGQVNRKEMVQTGLIVASICGPVLAAVIYLISIIHF